MISPSSLAPYADYTLPDAVIPELPGCYRGKVRENYDLRDGTRVLVATDRISAFDRILAVIPLKGQVPPRQRVSGSRRRSDCAPTTSSNIRIPTSSCASGCR